MLTATNRRPRDLEAKPQGKRTRGIQRLRGVMTGTPKTTCGKTMRMTAVWETRKQQMPARGTRELPEKRRESDEHRVGERFCKGDEGGAGGLQARERAQFGEEAG